MLKATKVPGNEMLKAKKHPEINVKSEKITRK